MAIFFLDSLLTNNFPLPSLKLTAKALKNGWLEYILGILFSYGGQAYFQGHLLLASKRVIGTLLSSKREIGTP